jgi:hypothetical protein
MPSHLRCILRLPLNIVYQESPSLLPAVLGATASRAAIIDKADLVAGTRRAISPIKALEELKIPQPSSPAMALGFKLNSDTRWFA